MSSVPPRVSVRRHRMRDLATESLWFLSNATRRSLSPIPPSASCNSCEMNNWCQVAPVMPAVLLRAQPNVNTTLAGYLKHNQDLEWGLSPSQSRYCAWFSPQSWLRGAFLQVWIPSFILRAGPGSPCQNIIWEDLETMQEEACSGLCCGYRDRKLQVCSNRGVETNTASPLRHTHSGLHTGDKGSNTLLHKDNISLIYLYNLQDTPRPSVHKTQHKVRSILLFWWHISLHHFQLSEHLSTIFFYLNHREEQNLYDHVGKDSLKQTLDPHHFTLNGDGHIRMYAEHWAHCVCWVNGLHRLIEVEPVFPVTVMEATLAVSFSFQRFVCSCFSFTLSRIGLQSTVDVFRKAI